MKKFLTLIISLIFILATVNAAILIDTSNAYAVEVSSVQLKGDYDYTWSTSIKANDNEAIDIRADIFLDYYNYYADRYYPDDFVEVWAEVFAWDDGWVFIKQTNTQTLNLYYADYKNVYWYDAFFIDDYYNEYKVVVKARNYDYYNDYSQNFAFVSVREGGFDSYCNDIEIFSNSVSMNENETEYITFNVKNNSDERFYINGVSAEENQSFFNASSYSNDSSIASGDTGQVKLKITSYEVNENKTGTATLQIKGEFNSGKTCNYSDIKKDFTVRVDNESGYESCGDIRIDASDETIGEDSDETFSFTVRNYSDTGFYVDNFDVSDNSSYFSATEDYSPSYISSGSEKEFNYRVSSTTVSGNQKGKIYIRVSGHYSEGKTCSSTAIGEKTVYLTVEDDYWEGEQCGDLFLNTKTLYVDEQDVYSASFILENNSGRKFYVQGINFVESSSELEFRNIDYPSYISGNSDKEISFDVKTGNTSIDKTITSYFEVKGYFENGRTCSFSDTRKRFDVKIDSDSSGSTSGSCNEIDVITRTVSLNKGETDYFEFTIENNENEKFYVDYVNAYDNDSKIETSEYDYPSTVNANSEGKIKVKIKANQTGTATAYIEIRGHFSGGKTCSTTQIGKESFTVNAGTTTGDSCSNFYLDAPATKSILGKEKIVLNINNPTNKTGTIRISGTDLSVSPYTIDVPKNTSFTKTIEVELLEGNESYLVYNISLDGCNITSKTTKVFSTQEAFEVTGYPREKTIGLEDVIFFTIVNNSAVTRDFKVSLQNLPSGWKANEKSISIPGNYDRQASIELTADSTGTYTVLLVVEATGRKIEKEIQLTVEEKEVKISAETLRGFLNDLQLKVSIENQTEEDIKGNLVVDLPENWTMEGNPNIEVEANSKKEILFSLKTDGTEKQFDVSLELDNGREFSTTADTKEIGSGTALISLGNNAGLAVGLLAIVIVVIVLLVKRQ